MDDNKVINWRNEYENNEIFRQYVDRYVSSRDITVDEALEHVLVHAYWDCINKGLIGEQETRV